MRSCVHKRSGTSGIPSLQLHLSSNAELQAQAAAACIDRPKSECADYFECLTRSDTSCAFHKCCCFLNRLWRCYRSPQSQRGCQSHR